MKCFYHSADLDGHCSGAIVKYRYPECEMIGINYGQPFPWDSIEPGELVVMVDFSLQPFDDMIRLISKIGDMTKFVWIDHHKSAIEEASRGTLVANDLNIPANDVILGKREVGQAGCELAWLYFFGDRELPAAVWTLGRYDVWDLKYPIVLPFQYGMRMYETNPENQDFWKGVFEAEDVAAPPLNAIVAKGMTVLEYIRQDNAKYAQSCSFETQFEGLRCIVMNKMLTNSQLFDTVWDREKYQAMMTFGFRHGKWTFSMYSDREDVDVSEVCKRYGGGGHKGAAGFQCDSIPFALGGRS